MSLDLTKVHIKDTDQIAAYVSALLNAFLENLPQDKRDEMKQKIIDNANDNYQELVRLRNS